MGIGARKKGQRAPKKRGMPRSPGRPRLSDGIRVTYIDGRKNLTDLTKRQIQAKLDQIDKVLEEFLVVRVKGVQVKATEYIHELVSRPQY